MGKILAFVEKRLARHFGERICETISEIESSFVAASFAEIAIRLTGDTGLGLIDGDNGNTGSAQKLVKFMAGVGGPPTVNNNSGFHEVDRTDFGRGSQLDLLEKRGRFGFNLQNSDKR